MFVLGPLYSFPLKPKIRFFGIGISILYLSQASSKLSWKLGPEYSLYQEPIYEISLELGQEYSFYKEPVVRYLWNWDKNTLFDRNL